MDRKAYRMGFTKNISLKKLKLNNSLTKVSVRREGEVSSSLNCLNFSNFYCFIDIFGEIDFLKIISFPALLRKNNILLLYCYLHHYLTTGVAVRQNMRSNLQKHNKYQRVILHSFFNSGKSKKFVISIVTGSLIKTWAFDTEL